MPQAHLDGRAAVGPGIEVRRDRLPVTALRRGGQAQQHARADALHEGIEAVSGQPVAFVHDDGVPVVGTHGRYQVAAAQAVDGGEQVVSALRLVAAGQQVAELGVAQHLAIGAQGLAQDLLAMRDEEKTRSPPFAAAGVSIVERSNHCLAGAGGGHHQVAVPAVGALCRKLLQHVLLVGLGLQVEEADRAGGLAAEGLASERSSQRLPVKGVVRVVTLEFAVGPERLEVGDRSRK